MNWETFLYNENFYRKLALTMAIIRLTPLHLTPKEYTIQLQNILRRNRMNEVRQMEQVLVDLRSLRQSQSIKISVKIGDLLESYGNFLQKISIDSNLENQTIILETIDRIVQLIDENFLRINEDNYQTLFQHLIQIMLNYSMIPNTIQSIRDLIELIMKYMKQWTIVTKAQILLEQIGCHQSYFLLVCERILTELATMIDQCNSKSPYGLILVNILQKLIASHDSTILEQIFNHHSVREQFHALLYQCLAMNNLDISMVIHLWNLYGRIL